MSREEGPERNQRTVAELLAKYGGSSEERGPRRRRRRPDDISDTAPQAIIERVLSDTGSLPKVEDDEGPQQGQVAPPSPSAQGHAGPPQGHQQDRRARRSRRDRSPAPESPAARTTQVPPVQPPQAPPPPPPQPPQPQPQPPQAQPSPAPRQPPSGQWPSPPTSQNLAARLGTTGAAEQEPRTEQLPKVPAELEMDEHPPAEPQAGGRTGQHPLPRRTARGAGQQPSMPLPQQAPGQPRAARTGQHPVGPSETSATQLTPAYPPEEPDYPVEEQDYQQAQAYPQAQAAYPVDEQDYPTEYQYPPVRDQSLGGDVGGLDDEYADEQPFGRQNSGTALADAGYPDGAGYAEDSGYQELGDRAEADDVDVDVAEEKSDATSPMREWLFMAGQLAIGVVGGAAVWLGFNWLWGFLPAAALGAAVVVIVGLVWIVRRLRKAEDLQTTVLAVLVGLVVTVSPAALLLLDH